MKTRIMLDENIPSSLKNNFSERFEVTTAKDEQLLGCSDTEVLQTMDEREIDVLVTSDGNLQYQHGLHKYDSKVVELKVYARKQSDLEPFINKIESGIDSLNENENVATVDLREEQNDRRRIQKKEKEHETNAQDITQAQDIEQKQQEQDNSSNQEPSHDDMASLFGSPSQEPEQEENVQQTEDQGSNSEQETSNEDHDPSDVYGNSQDANREDPDNEPER